MHRHEAFERRELVIDIYRARWAIEDYFKALKTGCRFESRQLEGERSLFNGLAVYVPIAAQILALRTASGADPAANATDVLSDDQLVALRALTGVRARARLTVADATNALARLGGHLRHNGRPGWQTLWRGFVVLELWKMGWASARAGPQK